jgi:hypothetical protein
MGPRKDEHHEHHPHLPASFHSDRTQDQPERAGLWIKAVADSGEQQGETEDSRGDKQKTQAQVTNNAIEFAIYVVKRYAQLLMGADCIRSCTSLPLKVTSVPLIIK